MEPVNESEDLSRLFRLKAKRERGRALRDSLFVLYFILFMISGCSMSSSLCNNLSEYLLTKFSISGNETGKYWFYSYLRDTLAPCLLYENSDSQAARMRIEREGVDETNDLIPIDTSNFLIGPIILRQHRVKREKGYDGSLFREWTFYRYLMFSSINSDEEMISMNNAELISKGESINSQSFAYSFIGTDLIRGETFNSKFGSYPSGGHLIVFPSIYEDFILSVDLLESSDFISVATRFISVEFNLWNRDMGVMIPVYITIEYFGSMDTKEEFLMNIHPLEHHIITPLGMGSLMDYLLSISELIVCCFLVYFFFEEATELIAKRLSYFRDLWNTIDWLNICILFSIIITRLRIYWYPFKALLNPLVSDQTKLTLGDPGTEWKYIPVNSLGELEIREGYIYTDLHGVASLISQCRYLFSLNGVFLSCKLLKVILSITPMRGIYSILSENMSYTLSTVFLILIVFFLRISIEVNKEETSDSLYERSLNNFVFIYDTSDKHYFVSTILLYLHFILIGILLSLFALTSEKYLRLNRINIRDNKYKRTPSLFQNIVKSDIIKNNYIIKFLFSFFSKNNKQIQSKGMKDDEVEMDFSNGNQIVTEEIGDIHSLEEVMPSLERMAGNIIVALERASSQIKGDLSMFGVYLSKIQKAVENIDTRINIISRKKRVD